ncbi:Pr6Pr family membrane protein [Enterococcus sp. LJL99]
MRNKSVVIFKIIFAILLMTGIIERAGLLGTEPQLRTFYSFTTVSNLFVFIICLVSFYQFYSKKAETTVYYHLRMIGVVMILITGFVYHFVLLPEKIAVNPNYQVFTYGNLMAHYVAPCLTFIDWLLFAEKGRIGKMEPFICTMIPVAYFIITSLIGVG